MFRRWCRVQRVAWSSRNAQLPEFRRTSVLPHHRHLFTDKFDFYMSCAASRPYCTSHSFNISSKRQEGSMKLDISALRYLTSEDWRVLQAVSPRLPHLLRPSAHPLTCAKERRRLSKAVRTMNWYRHPSYSS